MITKIILFCSVFTSPLLFISTCSEQTEEPKNETEYILFGHFYGFCVGEECIEIFKLTESELFEDDKDKYPDQDKVYDGNFVKLDDSKFELVKSIAENIPEELLMEQETVIGSPDAADGGGVYFAIKDTSGTKFWLIDQVSNNIPEYLRPFKQVINEHIQEINN